MRSRTPFLACGISALTLALTSSFAWAQSFTVTATPPTLMIHPGDQNIALPVTVSAIDGYTGSVTVTLTGLPSGIAVIPVTIPAGSSGILNVTAGMAADQEAFPADSAADADIQSNTVSLVGAAGSTVVSTPFTLIVSLENPSYAPQPGQIDLPRATIDTSGVPIVDKTTNVAGTITITSADAQTSYLPNSSDSDNTGTFHLHGNSTLLMPKKAYHIKLNTSLDLLTTMGLSCPYSTSGKSKPVCDKSKSFILLANYDDKSLLRDWAASALANAIPMGNGFLSSPPGSPSPGSTQMPWAPHSLFVELYLNGAYQGNYQLIEEVKVDSHRVNINELSDDDTDDVTGGYLLEIDDEKTGDFIFTTPVGIPIDVIDPDFSPEVPEQTSYITNYVNSAETALFSSNFTDPNQGWRAYFDEASAVNFYIVNDVLGNVDGGFFYSSDYLYKDINNPLLYMGPVWDFDISSGNVNYQPIVSPTVPWMQVYAAWYQQWFKDPGFKADVIAQWNALQKNGVFTAWIASIQQQAAMLHQSQANNFGRWPMQGERVWPNPVAVGSYSGEVAYLTNWIDLRIAYLDSEFNAKLSTSTALGLPQGATARFGTPFTLTAAVSGGKTPTGTVSFFSNGVLLGNAAIDGTGNASLTISNLIATPANVTAVYAGDATNALSSSPPTVVAVLPPLNATVTNLAALASTVAASSPATFNVFVLANSGTSTPTGTVTFTANGVPLGTAGLSPAGTASFTSTPLPPGSISVQASYGGDADSLGSTSGLATVNALPLGFTLAMDRPLLNLRTGQTTTATLTLTPINGYHGAVTVGSSNLPTNASCVFTQNGAVTNNISLQGGAPVQIGVAITANAAQSALRPGPAPFAFSSIALWWPAGLVVFRRKRSRRHPLLPLLVLAAVASAGLCGCSGRTSPIPPPQAFQFEITATPAPGSPAVFPQTVSVAVTLAP